MVALLLQLVRTLPQTYTHTYTHTHIAHCTCYTRYTAQVPSIFHSLMFLLLFCSKWALLEEELEALWAFWSWVPWAQSLTCGTRALVPSKRRLLSKPLRHPTPLPDRFGTPTQLKQTMTLSWASCPSKHLSCSLSLSLFHRNTHTTSLL